MRPSSYADESDSVLASVGASRFHDWNLSNKDCHQLGMN